MKTAKKILMKAFDLKRIDGRLEENNGKKTQ